MTKTEAKMRILAEWRTWIRQARAVPPHNALLAFSFFGDIQRHHPEFLSFHVRLDQDKWQIVKGWLQTAGNIKG
jgi:hypothetical protein